MPVSSWNGEYKRWKIEKIKRIRRSYNEGEIAQDIQDLLNQVVIGLKGPMDETLIKHEIEREEARNAIRTIFITGARVCEILGQGKEDGVPGLMKDDITFDEKNNPIFTIELEKKYEAKNKVTRYKATEGSEMRFDNPEKAKKLGYPVTEYEGYTTKKKMKIRRVTIPRSEKFLDEILEWENKVQREKMFDIKYNRFYRIITSSGENKNDRTHWCPHRLRAERATQLVLLYGMEVETLKDWMAWESVDQALDYASLKPETDRGMMEKSKEVWGGD